MKVAWREYEKYKGLREIDSPLKEKVHEYFKVSSTGPTKINKKPWNYKDAWCGAFLAWCFEQTLDFKKTNEYHSAAAFGWTASIWSNGENCEAFVGALIVFDYSHVAIIVGENLNGTKFIYLDGNQGNGDITPGNQKIILGSIPKRDPKIIAITKPKKYVITENDKIFPKYDVNAENSRESSR
ncbi:hypothetical protein [Pedobacter sp. MW01-1-1]|uniref:hypothetical protein n=1 Tax=Pedobacter sp. MW01-1-1 TaxID=3383027 RepID=UPI003FEFADCD